MVTWEAIWKSCREGNGFAVQVPTKCQLVEHVLREYVADMYGSKTALSCTPSTLQSLREHH